MESIIVVKEADLKQWMKQIIEDAIKSIKIETVQQEFAEPLLSREEIVAYLDNISLVTLHAWIKKGLPSHKRGGRVYFLKSEVLNYIRR